MDPLAPEVVVPLLRGRFGRPYLYTAECASTQQLLQDSALPEGAVAVTEYQTAGRGRNGRSWVAPPGTALLCSVLLRPPTDRPAPELSLVAGLAVAEALDEVTGARAQVKWPNDVLVAGRKVCGILAELRGHVVVGIGVNVCQTASQLPQDASTPAGSLLTVSGKAPERPALLASVLDRLERRYDEWRVGSLAALHAEIAARDGLRGRVVTSGERELVARGILPDGRLEVVASDGEVFALGSGEVLLDRR